MPAEPEGLGAAAPAVTTPPFNDFRGTNTPPAQAAFSDTVLARRPVRASSVHLSEDTLRSRPTLVNEVSAVPPGIQGIWVGLVCIILLVGSAGALRSLFDTNVAASGAPAAPGISSPVSARSAPPAPPPSAGGQSPTAVSSAATIGSAATGAPPVGVPGLSALAVRDRMTTHLRLRKLGEFTNDLEVLVSLDPSAIDRADVRKLVGDATTYSMAPTLNGEISPDATRLFSFLTGRAGAAGPDILFDIMTTRGGSRAATYSEELLKREDVRANGTPAFKIAYELKTAPSCDARKALFPRVKADGDRRAAVPLYQMAKCGKGPSDCCMANDQGYKDLLRIINAKK